MKRPPVDKLGISELERDMIDAVRRDRNCVLGIIITLMAGYFALLLIGGPL